MMGIAESRIIGTKVSQGSPLIRVGKRPGFFNFDHLQVHVGGAASDGLLPTIPFVFADIPGNGVPRKGKYYGSGNTSKVPVNLSQLNPGQTAGWVLESGSDFVKLQPGASDSDDAYAGAHLIVWYNLNGSEPWYEYHKVKAYNGDERKLTIEGAWLAGHPPPIDAHYRIGAAPYSKAETFDKHFAYLAARDGGGQPQPFPNGAPVNRMVASARYPSVTVTGSIAGGGLQGTSEVHLDVKAAGADNLYNYRHLVIKRAGAILQYRIIKAFRMDTGVPKITIDGVWDMNLQTSAPADEYEIGGSPYWHPAAVTAGTFLTPDRTPDVYAPDKLRDNRDPDRYYLMPIV